MRVTLKKPLIQNNDIIEGDNLFLEKSGQTAVFTVNDVSRIAPRGEFCLTLEKHDASNLINITPAVDDVLIKYSREGSIVQRRSHTIKAIVG
jgi:hypothetical protein